MNKEYLFGVFLIVFATGMTAVSQILLKLSARKAHRSKLTEYLNPLVMIGYAILVLTTLFSAIAVRFIPLSFSAALGATGQIFVPLMSWLILKEKIGKRSLLGMMCIVAGIVIFSL